MQNVVITCSPFAMTGCMGSCATAFCPELHDENIIPEVAINTLNAAHLAKDFTVAFGLANNLLEVIIMMN